jgi:4-diphosphocytidyl-2-C-methyl-D-erythritol kinase
MAARAKVNLWLRVGKLRGDGFHEVETVMLPLELADEIELQTTAEAGGRWNFSCAGGSADVPQDENNLALRAARRWAEVAGWSGGVTLRVVKRIPSGAGLGGGSSDAAAVLRGLQALHPGWVGREILAELAAELGSDVAFFLQDGAALCRGRGEVVAPVDWPWRGVLLLIKPPFGVPTGWAYRALDQWRDEVGWEETREAVVPWENDFWVPVARKYRVLLDLQDWLRAQDGVEAVTLAGSGSSMIAICREAERAAVLAAKVRREFGETFWCEVTRTADQTARD